MSALYIGLMSGTSLDGVDGVIADFSGPRLQVLSHASVDMPAALRDELLSLNTSGPDELHRAALAANALMRLYAQVVQALRAQAPSAANIRAIGAHGQTVRHRPQAFDGTGYTLQLCQPSLLAELCGIPVVADFRSRDVAAGGQGAPLAPLFHRAWLGIERKDALGVLNLGGISNLTVLHADGSAIGFDCGPGNALLDAWCQEHLQSAFDASGGWAAQGQVLSALLDDFLAEPYLALPAPKSTGRDLFHRAWLQARLDRHGPAAPVDVQATLAEFTARCCAQGVLEHAPGLQELVVCGGGAFNTDLMQRLARCLPGARVFCSDAHGLPPLQVEATAFAWLAQQAIEGHELPLQSITGARGARVLGGIYPA